MPTSTGQFWMALVFLLPTSWAEVAEEGPIARTRNPTQVDFERHVMGLLGRMGCNSGSCHGSFQGKNGFRLSLFGYDPSKDYVALTRDALGRRVDPVDVDRSLLLLKPTGQIDHGGGRRFAKDSWQYKLLRQWIFSGTPWRKGSGDLSDMTIRPTDFRFAKVGETGRVTVVARFKDGSQEDITRYCDFRVNDNSVAEVSSDGEVSAIRPGDTALVASYRGQIRTIRILVPVQVATGFVYPHQHESNFVDREVFAKLRQLNILPSELSEDAEFLRRLTIDTIGCLPSPDEIRTFLTDSDPCKRTRKIDELLTHPLHAALWATKFCDLTGNNTDSLEPPNPLKPKRSQMWHDWFRKRIAENMAYDDIVKGVLCATSRDGLSPEEWLRQAKSIEEKAETSFSSAYASRPSLDLFWRRQQAVTVQEWGEKTAAAFLGVRLECAQCHKHPFDRWTQADYRSYANIFSKVAFGVSPEAQKFVDAENAERRKEQQGNPKKQISQIREVFIGANQKLQPLRDPDTNQPLPAKALGGPEINLIAGEDPRRSLFDWLRRHDNPYFAPSFVNRVWGHYFGVGLVEPVDSFSQANPPSNSRLLEELARDFVDHGFDIRRLERTILLSRVYQLSSRTNETNRLDRTNFSHCLIRPMMAEVVVDVLNSALGVSEDSISKGTPDVRPGSRAIEVGPSRVQNGNLAYAFRIFGRPPRTSVCDCERAMDPALPQVLYRMTDPVVQAKLQSPRGRLPQIIQSRFSDEKVFEELVLATLSRFPTNEEKTAFQEYRLSFKSKESRPEVSGGRDKTKTPRKNPDNRQALFVDTMWALINTREFILNH
jgi:hypothetical protein